MVLDVSPCPLRGDFAMTQMRANEGLPLVGQDLRPGLLRNPLASADQSGPGKTVVGKQEV